MTAAPSRPATRLFGPFVDEIDGTMCISANATAADIDSLARAHRLRFPLILDPGATLLEQMRAAAFAPASSRFGPFCDNILGMNWRLPNGLVVRIGEQVVKSTTGYDWLRFLLHTRGRFGHALDYVLRLRPDCGMTGLFVMRGAAAKVHQAASLLLRNSWMHWLDAVDVIAAAGECALRVTVHCPPHEWQAFESYLTTFALDAGLELVAAHGASMPADGCPDVVFKTTPEHVCELAGRLALTEGMRCVALCYNGVVHGYLPGSMHRPERITELARPHLATLLAQGGDWHSRHLPCPQASEVEEEWIAKLESESSLA